MADLINIGGDSSDQDMLAARTLERLRKASEKGDRAEFLKIGKEIEWFGYSRDYNKLYEGFDGELNFKAKINRASEFVEVIGAELYPQNPVASFNSRKHATYWQKQRHKLEEEYTNYAMVEGALEEEARNWVNQGCMYGRGILWAGYDPRKKIVTHVFDTVDNFGIDPDAKSLRDANFVWRKRQKPRWELMNMYPKMREQIKLLPKSTERQTDEKINDPVIDLIEYYEYYFMVSLSHYATDLKMGEQNENGEVEVDDSPMKFCAVGQTLLSSEPWEIPFWRDGMWPCTFVDPRPRPGKIYPSAPMEPGLPHLKLLNWIYTMYTNRMRTAWRMYLIAARYNGQGLDTNQFMKVLHGNDMDTIILDVSGDSTLKIGDFIQQFKLDLGISDFETFIGIVSREFEKSTGLYEILYAGETQRQPRSATEVDLKKERSQSRIDDMKTRVASATTEVMRKTIFAARYLHTPGDIGGFFGQESAALWGTLAPPELVAQEQQARNQTKAMLMQQAQMMAQQASLQPPQIGMDGIPMPPMIPPIPTDDDLEQQLGPPQFVSIEAWTNEADREIESGSMRRMDHDAMVDNLNVALNQLAPAVVAMPGGNAFVAAIAREFTVINRYSPDLQDAAKNFYKTAVEVAALPPPPPAPEGATA
jgi:hypothetical protein